MKHQEGLQDPRTKYYHQDFSKQHQPAPGLQSRMDPVPDCGERSYEGHGRLHGRKILVTGADSGIGRAAAIAYAREGADLAINYLPAEEEDAKQVAALAQEAGRKVVCIPGDLSDEHFCKQLVEKARTELGGLDGLTLVAGKQTAVERFCDISTEQLKKTFEVNIFSLFWVIQTAMPHLPAGATIVTTSSVQAYQPSPNLVDYATTKAGIVAFTQALAKQVAAKGIRVNSVAPGPIWTALEITGGQPPEAIPKFGQSESVLGRAGQPAELASTYVFLMSEESSYVTAQVYGVTGGIVL
ncbi:NAD(P)-dependent dehydrogenase [Snodgrassella alvi]|uniref:SDR family oxidoreductase n=1 Tax=Snodgrassella TaxID=1193515 RepID=UPI0004D7A189|nr:MULTISPECIES: SDR family oxidoreductase [Snodgrassella]KES13382.1 Dehydrogenase with different specificity (related to short-chain alcohol dehydrogenase) [Snodgrassella alvi SCGC AB-598-P14]MBI0097888.1 SDR family oxidoreductase [Snodgrassella sp. W8134]MBI0101678.1 SDR family oxidoreductase [Snodgrassella sp. W8135]ORF25458.1 NAD(P)-dependent dehydrogenase [Snodgrassella alvi]ORF29920.1 NAD(P)-dependent dehydrogenase [Snodgrassella alvi]